MNFWPRATCFTLLVCSLAQAYVVTETFESYDDGEELTNFWRDTYVDGTRGVHVAEITVPDINDPGEMLTTKAAYFNLNETNMDPHDGDYVFFGTEPTIPNPKPPSWMQFDIAFKSSGDIDPELVTEVWYYLCVDLDNDGLCDERYETADLVGPLSDPGTLQTYPRKYLAGELADDWWRFEDDSGDWEYQDTVTGLSSQARGGIREVGFGFTIPPFDDSEQSDYMTAWIDNVFLVPEPSSFVIFMTLATAILFMRPRGKRR